MSTDNRTIINDCEANTGWSGSDAATAVSDSGLVFQGSNALATQYSNVDENMSTTQDSVGAGTFSLDWSDSTLYMIIKDNLNQNFASGGVQFIIGDATPDTIGYDVGGVDARGVPLSSAFNCYRLDVSVIVTTPGTFQVIAGAEANLVQTACTHIGYGGIHASKAVGAVDNCWMDCFRYIANGSYALTVNGGTVGTPETMADVVGDDVASGWGMVANPFGTQYLFAAPTQWGDTGTASSYFTASGEQWYFVGDNAGGHAIGAGNFPFRLIGNGTGTNSWVLNGVAIVNTGTAAEFDMSNTDMNIVEMDGCSLQGLGAIQLPSSGGTSRFTTNTIFSGCGIITSNGADMSGSSVLTPAISANTSGLIWNENADTTGLLDDMTFSKTAAVAHHAIEFGLNIPTTNITLNGCAFGTDFSNGLDTTVGDETFHFLDTTGTITLNLVGCTGNKGYRSEGVVVTIVDDPVTTQYTVTTDAIPPVVIEGARVFIEASDGTGPLPFEEAVTIVQTAGTATVTHTAHGIPDGTSMVIRGATQNGYNKTAVITLINANSYSYTVDSGTVSPATGSPICSGVLIHDTTNVSGIVSDVRVLSSSQPFKGTIRDSSGSPYYQAATIVGTVSNTTGFTATVALLSDE